MKYRKLRKILLLFTFVFSMVLLFSSTNAYASGVTPGTVGEEGVGTQDPDSGYSVGLTLNSNSEETALSGTIQMLLVITVISLAPSILVMVTSFTRIIVVLHFVRTAIGTQSSPPNNVLIGLSLFLTLFIMSPVMANIKTNAIAMIPPVTMNTEFICPKKDTNTASPMLFVSTFLVLATT